MLDPCAKGSQSLLLVNFLRLLHDAQSHHIHAILEGVKESEQVLVCRLIDAKITLVHRRLWPSLVRLAHRFAPEQLAQVREEHIARNIWFRHAILSMLNTKPERGG